MDAQSASDVSVFLTQEELEVALKEKSASASTAQQMTAALEAFSSEKAALQVSFLKRALHITISWTSAVCFSMQSA